MAKLRKMLGKLEDPSITALMSLIETQSQATLAQWTLGYMEKHVLGIYEKEFPEDKRVREALEASYGYLKGEISLKDAKAQIKEAVQAAKEADKFPAAQAAARSVSAGCAIIHAPTAALSFTFYGAAAIVYEGAGIKEKPAVYDALAEKEFEKILESLQEVCIPDETNPVKVKWYC